MADKKFQVIDPSRITGKNISEWKETVNGDPYFWIDCEIDDGAGTVSVPVFGKENRLRKIQSQFERMSNNDLIGFLTGVQIVKIEPSDFGDILPEGYYIPEYILKSPNIGIEQAVLGSKRRNHRYRSRTSSSEDDYESDAFARYGGPPDGYGGRVDDDFIDDVLGGSPDAYWNLD